MEVGEDNNQEWLSSSGRIPQRLVVSKDELIGMREIKDCFRDNSAVTLVILKIPKVQRCLVNLNLES